jgi:hypothetical protein
MGTGIWRTFVSTPGDDEQQWKHCACDGGLPNLDLLRADDVDNEVKPHVCKDRRKCGDVQHDDGLDFLLRWTCVHVCVSGVRGARGEGGGGGGGEWIRLGSGREPTRHTDSEKRLRIDITAAWQRDEFMRERADGGVEGMCGSVSMQQREEHRHKA